MPRTAKPPKPRTTARKAVKPKKTAQQLLAEIIEEQGVAESSKHENLYGAGVGIWKDEEEFQEFLRVIKESRQPV
jgi:hypothetical protein